MSSKKIVEDWVAKYGNNPEVDKIMNERIEYMAKIKTTIKKDSPAADIIKAAKAEKQAAKEVIESGKINLQKIPKEQLEQERNPNYKYFDIDNKPQSVVTWLINELIQNRLMALRYDADNTFDEIYKKAKQMEQEQLNNNSPELRYKDGTPIRKYNSPKLQAIEMENKNLTAVEWLVKEIESLITIETFQRWKVLKEQAKQMEEKQKKDEYLRGYVEGIDSGSSYHPD